MAVNGFSNKVQSNVATSTIDGTSNTIGDGKNKITSATVNGTSNTLAGVVTNSSITGSNNKTVAVEVDVNGKKTVAAVSGVSISGSSNTVKSNVANSTVEGVSNTLGDGTNAVSKAVVNGTDNTKLEGKLTNVTITGSGNITKAAAKDQTTVGISTVTGDKNTINDNTTTSSVTGSSNTLGDGTNVQ